ncbi:hypothetical protein O181_027836 [Austropuccinia psidii MF-1]|uniref:Uncharacterized protein n=1 Tax=Austropuccinia psidii MF-1 TaxID=1389203 RepID=A0A9Q3CT97_9BASI|nr:hypothetical protein [Austropuccinia psidii MF-1]
MSASRQHQLSNMLHEFFTKIKNSYQHHSQSSGNSTSWRKKAVGNGMPSTPLADHLPPLQCLHSQMNWLLHPPHHLCQMHMLTLRQKCPSATTYPYVSAPAAYLSYAPTVPYKYTSSPATPSLPSPTHATYHSYTPAVPYRYVSSLITHPYPCGPLPSPLRSAL